MPGIAHQIEYFRLAIAQDDHDGVYRWADRFVHAWMDNAIDECRLLLAGIKARQYEDEARYRKSVDTLAQHVTRLIELGEPERASFLAGYVIDYWRDNGWVELVDDGIEQLTRSGR